MPSTIESEPLSLELDLSGFSLELIRVKFTPRGREYTYMSSGDAGVGDLVLVPPNCYKSEPSTALVVGIGSNYSGPVTPIICVLRKAGT